MGEGLNVLASGFTWSIIFIEEPKRNVNGKKLLSGAPNRNIGASLSGLI
jgi:hypothetical protein